MKTILGELNVERHGISGAPAVVGWPSLFCDIRTLRGLVDVFAQDHDVVLIDGPGHGKSDGPDASFPLEACADAALQVLDGFGIQRAAWVGSAWGGHVGVLAVLRQPERFTALVTMNAPFGAWKGFQRVQNSLMYWTFKLLHRPKWMARAVAKMMLHPSHRAHGRMIVECMTASRRAPFFASVRSAMIERPSLLPQLPKIRVPTLVIAGEDDGLHLVEEARAEAARIPNAQFCIAKGSAHLSLVESAEARAVVRSFVTKQSGSGGNVLDGGSDRPL